MKTKFILAMLCLTVLLLNGCESASPQKRNGDDEIYSFDYKKSSDVLKNAIAIDDVAINIILGTVEFAGVRGIQSAEIIKDNEWKHGDVLAIESEDKAKYKLFLDENYTLLAIQDVETGTYILALVE